MSSEADFKETVVTLMKLTKKGEIVWEPYASSRYSPNISPTLNPVAPIPGIGHSVPKKRPPKNYRTTYDDMGFELTRDVEDQAVDSFASTRSNPPVRALDFDVPLHNQYRIVIKDRNGSPLSSPPMQEVYDLVQIIEGSESVQLKSINKRLKDKLNQ